MFFKDSKDDMERFYKDHPCISILTVPDVIDTIENIKDTVHRVITDPNEEGKKKRIYTCCTRI